MSKTEMCDKILKRKQIYLFLLSESHQKLMNTRPSNVFPLNQT